MEQLDYHAAGGEACGLTARQPSFSSEGAGALHLSVKEKILTASMTPINFNGAKADYDLGVRYCS